MASISKTVLMNRALTKIGVNRINSPDEQSEPARVCSSVYDTLVRAELRKNPWTCAVLRAQLPADGAAPAFGFKYAYPLPADFIRVVQVGDYSDFANIRDAVDEIVVPYSIERGSLLSDLSAPLNLRYVADISADPSSWDALLLETVACKMALEICDTLTKNTQKKQVLAAEYKDAIREAKRLNAIETPPVPVLDNSWLTGRY